jgi:hypothetical protein
VGHWSSTCCECSLLRHLASMATARRVPVPLALVVEENHVHASSGNEENSLTDKKIVLTAASHCSDGSRRPSPAASARAARPPPAGLSSCWADPCACRGPWIPPPPRPFAPSSHSPLAARKSHESKCWQRRNH